MRTFRRFLYFADIVQAAGKANGAMDFKAAFGEAVARGGQGNPWAFISVAKQCAREVAEKWVDRLGGVDIFTFE